MGDGDAPRLAPLDSCLRRNDACGRPPSSALRTGFDRLRANGFGRRAFGGEWGMRWGTETPRASPLWIPAFAGMTRAGGPLRVPSGQASTGSGRTDLRGAPSVGSGGCDGGRRRPAPRPSGYRLSPVRRWGWGGWRVLLVSGGGPALAGRAIRESPLRRGVGVGSAKGVGDGGAPPMPLWILASAGMTRVEGPLRVTSGQASTGSGRTDFGGAPLVGSGGCDGGWRRPAPRPSGFLPSQE